MKQDNGEGHLDGLDEEAELGEEDIVVLVDDEGQEYKFALLAIVEVEDQDYAMLSPLAQVQDQESEELELLLFQFDETEEGGTFSEIESDEIYEKVRSVCSSLLEVEEEPCA